MDGWSRRRPAPFSCNRALRIRAVDRVRSGNRGLERFLALDRASDGERRISAMPIGPAAVRLLRGSAAGLITRADQAETSHALVAALGLTRPTIVGHSFGAGAVVEYACGIPRKSARWFWGRRPALGLTDGRTSPAADPSVSCVGRSIKPVCGASLTAANVGECVGRRARCSRACSNRKEAGRPNGSKS